MRLEAAASLLPQNADLVENVRQGCHTVDDRTLQNSVRGERKLLVMGAESTS